MEVLLLPLGAAWYAVALERVREVVAGAVVEALPGAPPAVRGLANVRGEVVGVLDTAALLGLGSEPGDHLVLVDSDRGTGALTARGRPRTGILGDAAGPAELGPAIGRFAVGGDVATLLDLDALLHPARVGAPA